MTLNVEVVEYSEAKDNLCLSQDSIVPTTGLCLIGCTSGK